MTDKTSFKAPPSMRDDLSYDDWKREVKIWVRLTTLDKKQQGSALFLSLKDKARATVLAEVEDEEYDKDSIVTKIMAALDKLLKKNDTETAYQAFDDFIKFRRPQSMSIEKYMVEFNLRYAKLKKHKMPLPEGVQAYTLLECANLPESQMAICRATVTELEFDKMKEQIEKVAVLKKEDESSSQITVNYAHDFPTEFPTYDTDEYYYYDDHDYPEQGEENNQEEVSQNQAQCKESSTLYSSRPPYHRGQSHRRPWQKPSGAVFNPRDSAGYPITCIFCKSTCHMIRDCPHAPPHMKDSSHRGRGGRGYYRSSRGGYGSYRGQYQYHGNTPPSF